MLQEIEKVPMRIRTEFAKAGLVYAKAAEEVAGHGPGQMQLIADADAALQVFKDAVDRPRLAALMERYKAEYDRVAAEQTAKVKATEEFEKLKERWTRWQEAKSTPGTIVFGSEPQDPATFTIPEVHPIESGLEEELNAALDIARDFGRRLDNALVALDEWQNKFDELRQAKKAAQENLEGWRKAFDAAEAREDLTRKMRENQIAARKADTIKWAAEQRERIKEALKECGVEE